MMMLGFLLQGKAPTAKCPKRADPAGRKNRGLPFPFRAVKKKEDPMKKSLRSLLAFLIAATVLCCIAMADTGPKPSASFTFTGMPDEDYYVTMLAEVDAYGPHRVYQPGEDLPYVLEAGKEDPD